MSAGLFFHQGNPVYAVSWADETSTIYLFDLGAIGKVTWPADGIELPAGVVVDDFIPPPEAEPRVEAPGSQSPGAGGQD